MAPRFSYRLDELATSWLDGPGVEKHCVCREVGPFGFVLNFSLLYIFVEQFSRG